MIVSLQKINGFKFDFPVKEESYATDYMQMGPNQLFKHLSTKL